jgi:drug/metabolite transporter (DMT)-like permease
MVRGPVLLIIISGALFGLSVPLSKLLIGDTSPVALAGLLYLGAFLGLGAYRSSRMVRKVRTSSISKLHRGDAPYLLGATLAGGIFAPILLLTGLAQMTASSASLLLNLEGVATAILAVALFKEQADRNLWVALGVMTLASAVLSYDPGQGAWSLIGTAMVVLAMICWGVDNNLTQRISDRDAVQIAMVKGLVAGTVSLSLALSLGMLNIDLRGGVMALGIGAICYGASLALFVMALMQLGSCRTGVFFSVGPFVAAFASILFLGDPVSISLIIAAGLMALGVWIITKERHGHEHHHEEVSHEHMHEHQDPHHVHHQDKGTRPHAHLHHHPEEVHDHVHWPDTCHRHDHDQLRHFPSDRDR